MCKLSKSKLLILMVLLLALTSVLACSQASPAPNQAAKADSNQSAKKEEKKPVKVTVGYAAINGAMTPAWIAQEKGLFQKYGLDVNLQYISSSTTMTQAMISGEVPLAELGGTAVINANIAGSNLIMIAYNCPVIAFSVFGQPSIQRIEDLKGKVVGVTKFGSSTDFAARWVLKKYGLEAPKDVAIVEAGGTPETMAAMQAGGIQGTVTGPPNSVSLKKAGFRELVNIAEIGPPYIMTGVAVSKKYLANNEETVRNFLKAFLEGVAAGKQDKEFAKQTIAKYAKTDDQDVLNETYDVYMNDKVLPRVPYATTDAVQTSLDEIASQDAKVKDIKAESLVDNRLLKELDESGFVKKLYGN